MSFDTRSFAGAMLAICVAVLGTALASQYWGGLQPCELCLLQRWPWWAALALAIAAWLCGARLPLTPLAALFALVFVVSAGLAFYHVGVEQHWFAGPSACTGGSTAQTVDELRAQLLGKQPVMCDRPQWTLFGISLAGFNLLASLAMAWFCLLALRRRAAA